MKLFYKYLLLLPTLLSFQILNSVNANSNSTPVLVSVKTTKANLRYGPGKNYPIMLIFTKKNIPLLVIDKYNHWRKVFTNENKIGWIHKSQLSNKLKSIVLKQDYLRKKPKLLSRKTAFLTKNVLVSISQCYFYWCKIELQNRKYFGWYIKKYLWGTNYIMIK